MVSCTNPRCAFLPSRGGSPIFLSADIPVGSFIHPVHGHGRVVYLPCGGCLACRRERRQELTLLQCCEASLHDYNWFVTLTYDDSKLWSLEEDVAYSLRPDHLSVFNESMRKYCSYLGVSYRFFACGEYGERFERPHYHLSIFGLSPFDLRLSCDVDGENLRRRGLTHGRIVRLPEPLRDENGREYWQSEVISSRWPYGSHKIYRANRETFQYVAGYVVKKLRGLTARDFKATGRVLPFHTQSRPSIGRPWFDRFSSSISTPDGDRLINDVLAICDVEWRVPRIFSRWLESMDHFDGKRVVRHLSEIRSCNSPVVPDRFDLVRKANFDRYGADHYKQTNKHKEIR